MEELPFKIVKMLGPRDEVIARVENFLICKAAFEKALFVYPDAHLEMRQWGEDHFEIEGGAAALLSLKRESPAAAVSGGSAGLTIREDAVCLSACPRGTAMLRRPLPQKILPGFGTKSPRSHSCKAYGRAEH
jgi:hypothetical protein